MTRRRRVATALLALTTIAAQAKEIAPYRADEGLHWEKSEASLEDVFIELMGRARDNYQ